MGEELKKTLSFPVLLLIAINAIMGTGIFFLPAIGAREAGTASIIAWLVLSVTAIYVSLCFAELASMFPKAGGVYEYCKQAFGEFPSFIIGWGTLIAGNITIAMLVVGAIRYLNPELPEILKIGASVFFILVFNFIAYKGMDISKAMLVTFAVITLISLSIVIIPGLLNIKMSNFKPLMTHSYNEILIAMFLIAETFFGWETITFLSEETKDPRKTIPKALFFGTIIIVFISLLFCNRGNRFCWLGKIRSYGSSASATSGSILRLLQHPGIFNTRLLVYNRKRCRLGSCNSKTFAFFGKG